MFVICLFTKSVKSTSTVPNATPVPVLFSRYRTFFFSGTFFFPPKTGKKILDFFLGEKRGEIGVTINERMVYGYLYIALVLDFGLISQLLCISHFFVRNCLGYIENGSATSLLVVGPLVHAPAHLLLVGGLVHHWLAGRVHQLHIAPVVEPHLARWGHLEAVPVAFPAPAITPELANVLLGRRPVVFRDVLLVRPSIPSLC